MSQEVRDCLNGRPGAWEAFVRLSSPIIYTSVRRVLAGRVRDDVAQLCQDAVQDVFLRLIKKDFALLRSYDPARASLSTWLTIVSRSTALDELRKRSLPTVALNDQTESLAAPVPESRTRSDTPVQDLPPGLLSPRQALVLHMLFDRQLEVAQAAQILGVDEQTIRSARHKTLEKLRLYFKSSTER